MTAKIPESTIDKAQSLYESGLPLREVSEIVGRSEEGLRKHFKIRGVKMNKGSSGRKPPNAITNLPDDHICADYIQGHSENALANHYKVSRSVIRRILIKNNVSMRNQSESEKMKWSQMSEKQRLNQVMSAHKACKGRVRGDEELEKMALSREMNFPEHYVGIGEPELKEWLTRSNIPFKYQKACLSYNLDFIIKNVNVELTAKMGRNNINNRYIFERATRVFGEGYKTLYVEFAGLDRMIGREELIINTVDDINNGLYGESHYILLRLMENTHTITIMDSTK